MFTTQVFNQNILEPVGSIFVQRVESVSIFRSIIAGLAGLIGGRSELIEKKMNDLSRVLMEELQLEAKKKYPSTVALVDVKVLFSHIGGDESGIFLSGQASGTVLVKRPVEQKGGSKRGQTRRRY
jgi:uncharacterized protein YbjQ (UPF0145 family)